MNQKYEPIKLRKIARNMNQSNCVKSLITKILNTTVQVLKIK